MAGLLGVGWGVVLTILAFGLMVFFHELGHFLAAKLIGVRVEKFSFGFGPRLIGRRWGGTEYMISAVPVGGYVRMAGGDEGEEATGAPDEFVSKTPGQRAVVLAAGPVFSVLFGFPLAVGMLLFGRQMPLATVSDVILDSPAWEAGLKHGDRIVRLGRERVHTFKDLRLAALRAPSGRPVPLVVRRGGEYLELSATRDGANALGISAASGKMEVTKVEADSPLGRAGLKAGDTVLGLDGHPLTEWTELRRRFAAAQDEPFTLAVERGAQTIKLSLTRESEAIGVFCSAVTLRLQAMSPGSAGDVAGLRAGDVIRSVNGKRVRHWRDFRRHILPNPGRTVFLGVERAGVPLAVAAIPSAIPHRDPGFTIRLPREVGFVRPRFPADGQLQEGDRILEVNGADVGGWWDIEDAVADGPPTALLIVRRGEETLALEIERGEGTWVADTLGIAPRPVYVVDAVHKEADPPILPGDEVVAIGRRDVAQMIRDELYAPPADVLHYRLGRARRITVKRGEEEIVRRIEAEEREVGQLGVLPTPVAVTYRETLVGALGPAAERTAGIAAFAVEALRMLLSGKLPFSQVVGPVGILQHTYLSARQGPAELLALVHLITVSIGVFNLIPVPPLDGGRLLMLAIEKVHGRAPSRRIQEAIFLAGFALLIMVFVIATVNDIGRFF